MKKEMKRAKLANAHKELHECNATIAKVLKKLDNKKTTRLENQLKAMRKLRMELVNTACKLRMELQQMSAENKNAMFNI